MIIEIVLEHETQNSKEGENREREKAEIALLENLCFDRERMITFIEHHLSFVRGPLIWKIQKKK